MSESIMKEITAVGPKPITLDPLIVNFWFWKFVPVDPLVFFAPAHDGSIVQIARAGLPSDARPHCRRERARDAARRHCGRVAGDGVHGREALIQRSGTRFGVSSGSQPSVPFSSSPCRC